MGEYTENCEYTEKDEYLFWDIKWHLFQDVLIHQERERRLGEFMTDENTEELCRAFGVSPNTYEETPSGKRLYGSREDNPEWYNYAFREYEDAKKNEGHHLDIPGCGSFRYTEGNDTIEVPSKPIPTSYRLQVAAWFRDLPVSSSTRPSTGADSYQAPNAGGEGVPVTNGGVYMTQGPASQALKEQQRQDRERAAKRFAEASGKTFPRLDNRTKR